MDKQTPTQIASEKMKLLNIFKTKREQEVKFGEDNKDTIVTIFSLRNEIQMARNNWENELEFLDNYLSDYLKYCLEEDIPWLTGKVNSRISELTSALKILNIKEAEK